MSKKTDKKGEGIRSIKRKPQKGEYIINEHHRLRILELGEEGATQNQISKDIGHSIKTLKKNYPEEFSEILDNKKNSLKDQLYKEAMGGNTSALIFACKTIAGLKETSILENVTIIPKPTFISLDSEGNEIK